MPECSSAAVGAMGSRSAKRKRVGHEKPDVRRRAERRRDGGKGGDGRIGRRQGHDGAEGVASEAEASGVDAGPRGKEVEGGDDVGLFIAVAAIGAFAAARSAEVESKGRETARRQSPANGDDDVVVHVAAVEGMRMTHDGPGHGRAEGIGGDMEHAFES